MTMSSTSAYLPARLARRDLGARAMVVCAVLALGLFTVLDLMDDRLGFEFTLGFVLVVTTAALGVERRSLFTAGVLPPLLLIGVLLVVVAARPEAIVIDGMSANVNGIGRLLAAVIDHGRTLVVGQGLTLLIIAARVLSTPRVRART